MLELTDGTNVYFRFSNRPPSDKAGTGPLLLRLPSATALFISRYVDLVVIVALVIGEFNRTHRHTITEVAFLVQSIHLLCKVGFVWRTVRLPSLAGLSRGAARVTLQSEHSGYLCSMNLTLVMLLDGAECVGTALLLALISLTTVLLVVSRPLPRHLPVAW